MMMMKLRVGARRVPNSCSTPVLPQGNVLTRTRTRRRDTSFSTSKTVFINLYLDVDLIARTLSDQICALVCFINEAPGL